MKYSISFLLIVLGILIKYLKCYWLIAGYNTASQEKKEKIDIVGLSRFLGNSLFVLALINLIGNILFDYGYELAVPVSVVGSIVIILYILIYAQKYDADDSKIYGRIKKKTVSTMVIIIISAIVGGSILYSIRPSQIIIDSGQVNISGMYGAKIDIRTIKKVTLESSIPKILHKTNGFDFGNILKGHFELEDIGTGRIYINKKHSPYIYIETDKSYIIINYIEQEKTMEVYKSIKDSISLNN